MAERDPPADNAPGSLSQLLQQASALRQAGRFVEAADAYRQVLALDPRLPNSWYNLGWLERRLGRPEAALSAYDAALRTGVSQPEEVHLNRGVILSDDLNRVDDAVAAFEQALAINPEYTPAILNLANVREDRGRREEAAALYERALEVDPECWEGLARLANTRPGIVRDDPLPARLQRALARNDIAHDVRASLGFALGRLYDMAGDPDAAFAAYVAANRASAESAPSSAACYDPVAHERYIDELIRVFAKPVRPRGPTDKSPAVFICGMFRSGSTLLEQAMAGHPRVTAGGEIPALPSIAAQLAPFPASVASLTDDRLASIASQYRDATARLHPSADLLTDKRPDNYLLLGLAKLLFPEARFLHTVRNPLDTCLSIYFLHLDHSMSYAKDLTHIAHYFRQYRRLMAHWKSLYPNDIHDFDYDRFVRTPREVLEPALAFCGLEWRDACLDFHQRESLVRTASVWQVREPLYQRASGRARAYERHLGPLREALGDLQPAAS